MRNDSRARNDSKHGQNDRRPMKDSKPFFSRKSISICVFKLTGCIVAQLIKCRCTVANQKITLRFGELVFHPQLLFDNQRVLPNANVLITLPVAPPRERGLRFGRATSIAIRDVESCTKWRGFEKIAIAPLCAKFDARFYLTTHCLFRPMNDQLLLELEIEKSDKMEHFYFLCPSTWC